MNTYFSIQKLEIEDVKLITPFFTEDERGFFLKNFEKEIFKQWGLETNFFEDFETLSKKGVIRGLHFQTREPQIKIVRAIKGEIHDVVVDIRKESKSFGKYVDVILSGQNHDMIWIPRGFAHGFEVLSEEAIVSYKCVGKYLKEFDTGICWNDDEINIKWKTQKPIVSEKDRKLMSLSQFKQKYCGLQG